MSEKQYRDQIDRYTKELAALRGEVAEAIIAQLSRADADVTITVEIEANAPKGFDDGVQRTVTENARTLKFDTLEFEAE